MGRPRLWVTKYTLTLPASSCILQFDEYEQAVLAAGLSPVYQIHESKMRLVRDVHAPKPVQAELAGEDVA